MNHTATRKPLATPTSCALLLGIGLLSLGAAPPPAAPAPTTKPAAAKPAPAAAPAAAKPAPVAAPKPPAAAPAAVGDAEFPNIVTTGLTPLERETLKGLLTKFPSACGKPHSLLTSLRSDPGCKLSVVAGRWTAKLIGDGHLQSEIEEKYDRRFNKCYQIDVSGAQVYGDSSAPVTVVEFADFECPHCAITDPVLKQLVEQYKTKVKWVFMNYPIPMHPNAANAAAFALAAGRQGKFWEFKKKLFENQGQLDQLHIEQYAGEMKLDVGRLKADTEALRSRVRHERDIGERLDLSGTPSVYINCRKVEGSPTLDNLTSYVEAELAAR